MAGKVHPFVRLIWRLERWRGRVALPAGNWLGGVLFYGRPLLANAWSIVLQAAIREPALRYRCRHIGSGLRLFGPMPQIMGAGPIVIGDNVEFLPRTVLLVGVGGSGSLTIGDGVSFGPDTLISAAHEVRIGNHCRFGPGVRIYDTDMHSLDPQSRRDDAVVPTEPQSAPVHIEDDVWVGAGAIVLKGVTLHRAAVVGAGAVVTNDVPPEGIVAGNPARLLPGVGEMESAGAAS